MIFIAGSGKIETTKKEVTNFFGNKVTVKTGRHKRKADDNYIEVSGMSPCVMTFEFDDDTDELLRIDIKGRPDFKHSDKERFKIDKLAEELIKNNPEPQDIRHEQSVDWIKEEIKNKYEGKDTDELKFLLGNAIGLDSYPNIVQFIAEEFLEKARDARNAKIGPRRPNREIGKLGLLLKPYIKMGKDAFEDEGINKIEIPRHKKIGQVYNFYESLINYLGTNKIEIDSWDMLLDLYFTSQYDDPATNINDKSYIQKERLFLDIYQKYGVYSCVLFKPASSETDQSYEEETDLNQNNNNNQRTSFGNSNTES